MKTVHLLSFFLVVFFVGCGSGDKSKSTDKSTAKATAKEDAQPTNIEKVATGSLTPTEIADGWINLFDGESLFGWNSNHDGNWRVEDGLIVCDKGDIGLLQTSFQFSDYEFRCDFKLETGGNSGVFLRSAFKPADPGKDCYELNMCDTHEAFATGSMVGRVKAESVPPTDGEWHTWHVTLKGTNIIVRLDGAEILNLEDTGDHSRSVGHIGLQFNKGRIEFRNVTLRPLGGTELFDGTSLTGWREVPGSKSDFTVADGTIVAKNGPGFLETEKQFDNFVLQTTVRTNDIGLNSGIFFRAKPGTEDAPSHGYEMQINNAVANNQPGSPLDTGTGGIFRRQDARRVNGIDKAWTTTTLIAQGNHFGSWVNGYPVVDWTDNRAPDDNPRKGQRLKAGHISLQGHDPTTDLAFRSLTLFLAPTDTPAAE